MLNENDLYVAMERGIITREQLEKLELFANERDQDLKQAASDETPRFVRSFGDLFIAIGVVLFTVGLGFAVKSASNTGFAYLLCAISVWGLAEWITRRLRLSAPSIVLASAFCGFFLFAGYYFLAEFIDLKLIALSEVARSFYVALWALAGVLLFYVRFRLPFSVLLIGILFCFLVPISVEVVFPDLVMEISRWLLLGCGLTLFAVAMIFDLQDPLRSGRASDAGFWLHLVSAPIITHSILLGSVPWGGTVAIFKAGNSFAADMVVPALLFLVVFAFVAILIDRRALLAASLGYAGSVIAYGIWSLNLPVATQASATLIVLAALILALGTGWRHLRIFVFRFLPKLDIFSRLPPVDS